MPKIKMSKFKKIKVKKEKFEPGQEARLEGLTGIEAKRDDPKFKLSKGVKKAAKRATIPQKPGTKPGEVGKVKMRRLKKKKKK